MNGDGVVSTLEGDLVGVEPKDKGRKVLTMRTNEGDKEISFWGEIPEVLGGENPKMGARFKMTVVAKTSKDGQRVFLNLHQKTRDGDYEISQIGQVTFPQEKKGTQMPPIPVKQDKGYKETTDEFRLYQKGEMLSCIVDAEWVATEVKGKVALTPETITEIAVNLFNKRTKHQHYFDGE